MSHGLWTVDSIYRLVGPEERAILGKWPILAIQRVEELISPATTNIVEKNEESNEKQAKRIG